MTDLETGESMRPDAREAPGTLTQVTRALVGIYKEKFGRGPRFAHSHFAGKDMVICVLGGTLTPIEQTLAGIGEHQQLQNIRQLFQATARARMCAEIERIVGRPVVTFMSGNDVDQDVACEVFGLAAIDEAPEAG
jgi:uncharacterized protein YbcI